MPSPPSSIDMEYDLPLYGDAGRPAGHVSMHVHIPDVNELTGEDQTFIQEIVETISRFAAAMTSSSSENASILHTAMQSLAQGRSRPA